MGLRTTIAPRGALLWCVPLCVLSGVLSSGLRDEAAAQNLTGPDAGVSFRAPGDSPGTSPEQDDLPWYLRFEDPGPLEALLTWYPPLFIRNGIDLKDFIRSETFSAIRRREGDPKAADAIFVRAMTLTHNNTSVALLLATVATFDHYVVGVKIPLLNFFFPLSNESREDFAARIRNLPARLYADSPRGGHGDRDKLQHFFGSACIAYTFESQGAAGRMGDFIEVGEDAAIVDGVLDSRDERANWNGSQFGTALLANNKRYPSDFFRAPVAVHLESRADGPDNTGCR